MVGLVRGFLPLLPCTHEATARNNVCLDLRQVHLHHHTLLSSVSVSDLGHPVARTPNLEEDLLVDILLSGRDHELGLLQVARRSAGEVRLMLLSLRVCEVGAFVGVQRETETTFQGAKVVAQDVGVLDECQYQRKVCDCANVPSRDL